MTESSLEKTAWRFGLEQSIGLAVSTEKRTCRRSTDQPSETLSLEGLLDDRTGKQLNSSLDACRCDIVDRLLVKNNKAVFYVCACVAGDQFKPLDRPRESDRGQPLSRSGVPGILVELEPLDKEEELRRPPQSDISWGIRPI